MRITRPLIAVPSALIAVGMFLTGDVAANSILRGVPCSLTPVPAAEGPTPVGSGPCPGIRPGGRVLSTIADCTLNFLFRAAGPPVSARALDVGTMGITRLRPQLARASAKLGVALDLVTAG